MLGVADFSRLGRASLAVPTLSHPNCSLALVEPDEVCGYLTNEFVAGERQTG